MADYSILGKRFPRVDALDKATGRALYSADISVPNMLYGKLLQSPFPHAKIRRLNINKAMALEGVMGVITASDVPDRKGKRTVFPPLLAKDKVVFAGQPVAAIAAIDPFTAEEALALIEIDYEELPYVMDISEALRADAPRIFPDSSPNMQSKDKDIIPNNVAWHAEFARGDIEAGFKEALIVIENTFKTQSVHQGYLETRASLADVDTNGRVTIWTDSQNTFLVRELCADFMDIPLNHVRVIPVEVGGAFGGKQFQPLSPLCALLSRKTGRAVKMVMARKEDFTATCPAPATSITLKMGVSCEGRLTAVLAELIWDIGAFPRGSITSLYGSFTGLSLYRIPNFRVKCFDVVTNKTPIGTYRAPSAAEAAFAVESQMDLLALALGMDPLEFRLINAVTEGDKAVDGSIFPKIGFIETLHKMKEHVSHISKPERKNQGIGIACGFWPGASGACAANINVNDDGSVALIIGSCDLTGTRTSLAQIVAEEFSIPLNQVTVTTGDTDTAPYSTFTAGSRITKQMGTAVYRACQDAKEQLIQLAASQLDVKPVDFEFINGQVRAKGTPEKGIPMSTLARISIIRSDKGPVTGRGSVGGNQDAPMFVVQRAGVDVDSETGKVKILSYASAQDVGFAINPTLIEGQIHGAIGQGIGRALLERYIFNQGVMQNANFLDYLMPTAADLCFFDTILVEIKSGVEPFGIRGVGEPPMIPTLAAIANAIHNASGVRLKELPMTPEAIFYALKDQRTNV